MLACPPRGVDCIHVITALFAMIALALGISGIIIPKWAEKGSVTTGLSETCFQDKCVSAESTYATSILRSFQRSVQSHGFYR